MKKSQTHLLVNAKSRQADNGIDAIQTALSDNGISIDRVHEIDRHNDIASLCATIVSDNAGLLIIAGGDGTVSSALHYLADSAIEIGIIPLGTTNNFARSLRLPTDLNEAAALIASSTAQPVDLGMINDHHFANVVGLGLSSAIALSVSDKSKKRFGRAAYALAGIRQLITHRAFTVTISDKDKEIAFEFETHQVIVANGRYHAGKKIAQDVAVDNRELVIFALGGRGWLSFSWHTLDFYLGRRKKIVHGSYVVGNNVTLTTSRPQKSEVDGEPGPKTPLELRVHPGAVMVRRTI